MKRVAVLRGGPSEEYAVSMKSGDAVLEALKKLDYQYKDIVVTKNGEWLESGFVKRPDLALKAIDVVFVALHGQYGEDGKVQRILENEGIPYTGSQALPSAIAFNKELAKRTLKSLDINLPRHRKMNRLDLETLDNEIPLIFSEIGKELFVKPVASGSSLGARHAPNESSLRSAIIETLELYDEILIEEYIRGKEATVGVVDNFRNESVYILPAVEVVPPKTDVFYSANNKYDGSTELICPGRFSYHEKAKLAEAAELVHKTIGCRHYSRSDFIIRDGEVYFLEINSLPVLTPDSPFIKSLDSVGFSYSDFVAKQILDLS